MFTRTLLALAMGLLLATPVVFADDVLKPTKAQSAFRKAMKKVPQGQKEEAAKEYAVKYLKDWAASGKTPTPTDKYALAQFRQSAGEFVQASREFQAVQSDEGVKEKTRDYAAAAEALLLLNPTVRGALGKEPLQAAVDRLTKYAAAMGANPGRSKGQTKLMKVLAQVHAMGGAGDKAHELRMQIIKQDPKSLSGLAGPIMQDILSAKCAIGEYDALRKRAESVMKTLTDAQAAIVAEKQKNYDRSLAKLKKAKPDALDADGNLKKTSTRGMSPEEKAVYTDKRSLATATSVLEGLAKHTGPLAVLGKAAPEWTLENAFGDISKVADLKGKVAILDFWGTWSDYNSFPVLRDLLKSYGEKGLVVVGVTATSHVVYETRYDTDPDMKSKMEPGARLYYAARLSSEKNPADESKAIYDAKEYREIEMQAIEAFRQNHEMSWPSVMIDADEPAAKYAAASWPHLVVLDKEGRMRFVRSGSFSRDKTQLVATLRSVIEGLLAE